MKTLPTHLNGPLLIEPRIFPDARGFFHESYRRSAYAQIGIVEEFVQDNHSRSVRGVVRGMHFQLGAGTSKLVRCARGAILDVLVDLRRGSPTFGGWEAFELNEENLHQLYCPVGFGHGFCVLSDLADVLYKQSSYYDGALESAVAYDDPDIAIAWPDVGLSVSERDASAPLLRDIAPTLPFTYRA